MRDLKRFREQIEAYYKQKVNKDGNRYTQRELAGEIGLNKDELSKRLNAYEDPRTKRTWFLTDDDVLAIVRTLAKWNAITTQEQAINLLELMAYPHLSTIDWQTEPLRYLRSTQSRLISSPMPMERDAERRREEEKQFRLRSMLTNHSGFIHDRLESFVGREAELAELRERISEMFSTGGYIIITGQAGQGKSSIIAKLVQEYGAEQTAHHFIPFNPGPGYQVSLLRDLMARLILKHNISDLYIASESLPILRDCLPKILTELTGKGRKEVIFIDGLDQLKEDAYGERDLSFLPNNPPGGIVIVLGTRPNDTLRPLELYKPHYHFDLPNVSRQDFDRILEHRGVGFAQLLADQFYQAMQENALYLDLVAKELAREEEVKPEELIRRLADNPGNIFSLSMARLKRFNLEWREVLKPLLGLLLAAREPLTLKHIRQILAIDDDRLREDLRLLGGLLATDGRGKYFLFHLKLYDYLRQDEGNPHKEYIFAADEVKVWHKKLADWCRSSAISYIWTDIERDQAEQERRTYAREHYIAHLYNASEWQQLFEILDSKLYGRAKIQYDPSTRSYAQDLDFGRQAAAREGWTQDHGIRLLPRLWRYTLLRCSLASRADMYTQKAFEAMLLMNNNEHEVVGLAELLTDPLRKASTLLQIAKWLGKQRDQEQEQVLFLMKSYRGVGMIMESEAKAKILLEMGTEFARMQQWERAEAIWTQVKETIQLIGDNMAKVKVLLMLGKELARAQQWKQAGLVWSQVEEMALTAEHERDKVEVLQNLSRQLVEVHQWERAEKVWSEIELMVDRVSDNRTSPKVLLKLGAELARADRWEQAERVWLKFEKMAIGLTDNSNKAQFLLSLAIELARVQQVKWVETIWAEVVPILETFRESGIASVREIEIEMQRNYFVEEMLTLGTELAKAQQWERAEAIWSKVAALFVRDKIVITGANALEHALTSEYAQKLTITRANALVGLCINLVQAQQWESVAAEWTQLFQAIDHIRSEVLLQLGIALARAQQWERAATIWKELKVRYHAISNSDKRVDNLLELCIELTRVQQWKQANAVWAEIALPAHAFEDGEIKTQGLLELGTALIETQQWEHVEELAQAIGDEQAKVELLLKGVSALIKVQRWEQAEELLDAIADPWPRSLGLLELGRALIKAKLWERATTTAGMIDDSWVRNKMFLTLCVELARVQQWEQVKALENMIEDAEDSAMAFLILSTELAKAQYWESAKEVASTIRLAKTRAEALLVISGELANAQRWEYSEATLAEAEQTALTIIDRKARFNVLLAIGTELTKAQRWEQAEELWVEAEKVAMSMKDSETKTILLLALGAELARAQRWKQAKAIWAEVEKKAKAEKDSKSLLELSVALAKAGMWEQALEAARTLQDNQAKALALLMLGSELAKEHGPKQAGALWIEVQEVAHAIERFEARTEVLLALGTELANTQQWNLAETIWVEAEEVANTIEKHEIRAEALLALGEELTVVRSWERAQAIWNQIEEEAYAYHNGWDRAEILLVLCTFLARKYCWEQALAIVYKIEDGWARSLGLLVASSELAKSGQGKRAKVLLKEVEEIENTIQDSEEKLHVQKEVVKVLSTLEDYDQLLGIVQRSWLRGGIRKQAIEVLPLATKLIHLNPEIGPAMYEAFTWVDDILKG